MKVHFIKREYIQDLEADINEWIQSHPGYEILDIKYGAVPWGSSSEYSVMIIYRRFII